MFFRQKVVHDLYFVTFSSAASPQFRIVTVEEHPGSLFTVFACCEIIPI